jgi:hypothetical protein
LLSGIEQEIETQSLVGTKIQSMGEVMTLIVKRDPE